MSLCVLICDATRSQQLFYVVIIISHIFGVETMPIYVYFPVCSLEWITSLKCINIYCSTNGSIHSMTRRVAARVAAVVVELNSIVCIHCRLTIE